MNINNELKELRLANALLSSNCIQSDAGLEAIDPQSFFKHLVKLTEKSGALVKYILNNKDVTINHLRTDELSLNAKVLAVPFTRAGDNIVLIPPSLIKLQSEFCEFLVSNKKSMLDTDSVLQDANSLFSEYLTAPENLMKLDVKRIPKLESIGDLPKEFGTFFMGSDGIDRMVMHKVYKSYADFNVVSESLSKLTKEFSEVSLRDIKTRVDDFFETLDYISNKIESDAIEVSKPTAKALGQLIYNIADWVATYSLYLTKLSASAIAHKDTVDKLNG